MRNHLENMSVGVTMMNLNAGMIANLKVIMPPLELQTRFAAFAEAADKSKFVVWEATRTAVEFAILVQNKLLGAIKNQNTQYEQEERNDV
jgi:hypothetical protein